MAYLNGKALFPLSMFDALWRTLMVGIDHKNSPFCGDKIYGRELFDAFWALLLHTVSSQDDNPRIETFNRHYSRKRKPMCKASTGFRTGRCFELPKDTSAEVRHSPGMAIMFASFWRIGRLISSATQDLRLSEFSILTDWLASAMWRV